MGLSTDAIICYGYSYDEDYTFPWDVRDDDNDVEENDIEDWWVYKVHGYKPPFEIFDHSTGGYINGERPDKQIISDYFDDIRKFKKKHPIPVKLVRHCSADYPMYIVAVPSTHDVAWRGYPVKISSQLIIERTVPENELKTFNAFCDKYDIAKDGELGWWLASDMG